MELTAALPLVHAHTVELDPTGDWSVRAAARHIRTAMDRDDVAAGAIEDATLRAAYLTVIDAHAADIDGAIACNARPFRAFGNSQSVQADGKISLIGPIIRRTIELDRATDRGAALKVTAVSRYGTQAKEVTWYIVRPDYRFPIVFPTRRQARAAIGA